MFPTKFCWVFILAFALDMSYNKNIYLLKIIERFSRWAYTNTDRCQYVSNEVSLCFTIGQTPFIRSSSYP